MTSTGKHTPGPWTTQTVHFAATETRAEHDMLFVVTGDKPLESDLNVGPPSICRMMFGGGQHEGEAEANARLIASVTDLLSLAERWVALDAGAWAVGRYAAEKAQLVADTRAAIAKATGGA